METTRFQIGQAFARSKNIPVHFIGVKLRETAKAVYVYGHGSTETLKTGVCCICGRTLTHPVSVELGIGPECGSHYWDWDAIGGYTLENIERLKGELVNITVDTWMPKSIIKSEFPSEIEVVKPLSHPMIDPPAEGIKTSKKVEYMIYQTTGMPGIKITFPYDLKTIDRVKQIPGRRFISTGSEKYWVAPLYPDGLQQLIDWGFELCPTLMKKLEFYKNPVNATNIQVTKSEGLNGLFPFQKKGVAFIDAKDGRALIADEMGLGKTVQALGWLQIHPESRPVIIVVPASLKLNWERETKKWVDNVQIQIISGTKTDIPIVGNIIIINYDILPQWREKLAGIKPKVLILDECHYFKNNGAKRTKAVKVLAKGIPHVIALSGTPIVNRPVEIYNAVKLIDPYLFPHFPAFGFRYCAGKHNGYGWDYSGASNVDELHDKLVNSIMIRRRKTDVLKDLPDKTYSLIPMELTNGKEYMQAERDFIAFVREYKGAAAAAKASQAEALVKIEGLKQLAVAGKMKQAVEWVQDFLETGNKLVIFAIHKTVIDTLMEAFGNIAVKVDGSVSMTDRQKAVDIFQNPDSGKVLFVGNIKAAGVGLTLTAASNVAILELPWTPGDLVQAEDRCHRIGQKDNVNVHYLLAANSIEERLAGIIDAKRQVLDKVLDGIQTDESSLLRELMESYK